LLNIQAVPTPPGGECFLLTGRSSSQLLVAGFGFCGGETARQIQSARSGRGLDYILLTHSHYDHVGGAPAVKALFPEAVVAGSPIAGEIFARKGAQRLMRDLDRRAALLSGIPGQDMTDSLRIDKAVSEGDVLNTADFTVPAIEAPGHTRCCTSFYIPEEELLLGCETLGVVVRYPEVVPGMLVSFGDTLRAISAPRPSPPPPRAQPHGGGTAGVFAPLLRRFPRGRAAYGGLYPAPPPRWRHRDRDCPALQGGISTPPTCQHPALPAFDANTNAMIPRLLAEMGLTPRQRSAICESVFAS
jgi:glyoxylase-like metal-dependent hydrolase (beta-lactamase superfamily II)